ADLDGVRAIRADSKLPGFRGSDMWPLAKDKVRHVGEPIAACVAPTRAAAEDLAEAVGLDVEPLPAVVDMRAAREPSAPLIHEHWSENVFLESRSLGGADIETVKAKAAVSARLELRTARQSMAPIEGRGTVAEWDARLGLLTLTTGQQMPHVVRSGLALCLGMEEGQVRLISPDVGGGFGYKGILSQEDVVLGWLAIRLGRPVRWIEDRREQLTANANCREHWYDVTGYASAEGDLLGIEARAIVDAGAYSLYPFSACLEGAQVGSILPGPYDFEAFRCDAFSACTNKPGILPYRGVARTGVCFALELTMDALAQKLGMEPSQFRIRNLVKPEQMPFDNVVKKHFDSGDYPEAVRRAEAAIDLAAVRARQRAGEADGRRIGLGIAVYCEQAAHGTSVYSGWGVPFVPGFEQATARLTPDGGLEVRVGAHSHGQGMETSLAQVANEVLGVDVQKTRIIHGDTSMTPYSTGTWGSRCGVMVGGAVATACETLAG
ncbi:MAG: xanthine dehydrogenase family protein, partial [Alphaproteobacteria bacterium]